MKKLIVKFLKIINKGLINKLSKDNIKHQPVFIIGAPRTGSTILYQAITNELNVTYIDNLSCKFNKVLFLGQLISNIIFRRKSHNCFKSDHGKTKQCNLHAPSECGGFWYNWLPKNKHFIDFNEIDKFSLEEMKLEITAISNFFSKPLIFKNLNAGQRMRMIKEIFPKAKFILIKRDPLFTAQSILKAKRKSGKPDDEFWSVMPKNIKELEKFNTYEQIIKQIYYLEKQIIEDSKLFDKENFLTIDYCEFGNSFQNVMIRCKQFIDVDKRDNYEVADIKLSEKLSLEENELILFKEEIDKLDWENYSD
ncbi:sulfotransferase [Halarcobacter sp.]|uniref:sulfotransferase n=1 Tax=Halarcobacter sp. TaxID=2321133 RepID=UPI003A8E3ADB